MVTPVAMESMLGYHPCSIGFLTCARDPGSGQCQAGSLTGAMSEDEIAVMDGGKCILQLRGVRPFFSEKYDITKHPKYKYLSDFDKKNAFDMEKHLRRRPAIVKPDEVFDYYEVDEADLQEDAE